MSEQSQKKIKTISEQCQNEVRPESRVKTRSEQCQNKARTTSKQGWNKNRTMLEKQKNKVKAMANQFTSGLVRHPLLNFRFLLNINEVYKDLE
jgi:hypothetical protein